MAEAALGALMRTVGGVGPTTHTVVLSVMFRVLCAAGLAAFAWKHRRNSVLVFLTILSVPALFLLQKFFGYMDNFMTLALLAGVLILLDRMPDSWSARVAVTLFMFVGGMSHPTTLVIFLAAMGAVAVYRLLRERSLLAALRSEGLIVATGTVAVVMTAAFWLGAVGADLELLRRRGAAAGRRALLRGAQRRRAQEPGALLPGAHPVRSDGHGPGQPGHPGVA